MGWKGTVKTIVAAQKRYEREAAKHQRELEKRQKQLAKMEALEQARFEVDLHENRIDLLMSVHKDCGKNWDWVAIAETPRPEKPVPVPVKTQEATKRLNQYKPGFLDRLFKREEKKRKRLREQIDAAKQQDQEESESLLQVYNDELEAWEKLETLATGILNNQGQSYLEAIEYCDPFSEISALGSSLKITATDDNTIIVDLSANGEEVIPKEDKKLLKSGKLSNRPYPKGQFYALYQDYICSAVLRIAREIFALLPAEMTIITVEGELLNSKTGHLEKKPILSVGIPRATLTKLNLENIDPSDSMSNFKHNIKFQKTKGFLPVDRLSPNDFLP